jgi:hypothetical protein
MLIGQLGTMCVCVCVCVCVCRSVWLCPKGRLTRIHRRRTVSTAVKYIYNIYIYIRLVHIKPSEKCASTEIQ